MRLCVWGGWAGTQPVIPALWSSLTKREAGTAQPARTHTCTHTLTYTNTQTVTQRHAKRVVQGSTPEHAPALDPLALCPRSPGQRVTRSLSVSTRRQETRSFSSSFLQIHTHTHTNTPRESGQLEKDVKAGDPVPRKGEKRQEGG